jgi:hypothetical protein
MWILVRIFNYFISGSDLTEGKFIQLGSVDGKSCLAVQKFIHICIWYTFLQKFSTIFLCLVQGLLLERCLNPDQELPDWPDPDIQIDCFQGLLAAWQIPTSTPR